jgi:putative sigma-54 modulation protein
MQVTITARHMEMTDALRNYVETKLEKLDKYLENIIEVHVTLEVQKYRHIAEVMIRANGFIINGEDETGDMYSSIDNVIDKIERQLVKHKGRVVGRKQRSYHRERSSEILEAEELLWEPEEGEAERRVIHTERFVAKPMSVEEAVMQMDLLKRDFMVFRNAQNEQVNVLYKRRDGNFGLIQPT